MSEVRRRRDAGSIRLSERDRVGLDWCATQGALRLDQLARLFAHLDNRPVSVDAARKTVDRWLARDWAVRRVLLVGRPPFVWLTTAGLRVTGRRLGSEEPALATVEHSSDVVDVRIALSNLLPGSTWRSEREIRAVMPPRARGERVAHVPDAEIFLSDGRLVAIERERVAKTLERTRHIQLGLLTRRYDYDQGRDVATPLLAPRYDAIWYYASEAALSIVTRSRESLPEDLKPRLEVVRWP